MDKEIHALTGLRGIAALWVLGFHALRFLPSGPARAPFSAGYLGVDLFFVLSGFVLAYNYAGHRLLYDARTYSSYLWKRLARIYPMHIFVLGLYAACAWMITALGMSFQYGQELSAREFAYAVLLINAWVPSNWNPATWSLSAELCAYIAFPVIVAAAERLSRPSLLLIIGVLYLGMGWAAVAENAFFRWNALERVIAGFTSGVLLYRLWSLNGRPTNALLALVGALLLLVCSNWLGSNLETKRWLITLPISSCVLVYGLASSKGIVARWLSTPVMMYLGRISYGIYMCHVLVVLCLEAVFRRWHLDSLRPAAFFLSFAGSLTLAHFLYTYIEQPARRAMLALRPATAAIVLPVTR